MYTEGIDGSYSYSWAGVSIHGGTTTLRINTETGLLYARFSLDTDSFVSKRLEFTTESRSYFTFGAVTMVLGVVTSSEVNRPDHHLGAFGGVVASLPGRPVHAFTVRRVMTVVVQAVQVGGEAPSVPPGASVGHGAAPPIILVVVSVFGAEGHRIVPRQWVPRCTYVENISLSRRPILSMCYLYTDQFEIRTRGGGGGLEAGGCGGRMGVRRQFEKTQRTWRGAFDNNTRGVGIWFGASISCFDVALRLEVAHVDASFELIDRYIMPRRKSCIFTDWTNAYCIR